MLTMRLRRKNLVLALPRAVLLALAFSLLALSAGRFGFKAALTQCPTAPVQQITIMTKQADGTYLREVRAPRPGEKDFVVCHCQEKRSTQQTGWYVPAFPLAILADTAQLNLPILMVSWDRPAYAFDAAEPRTRVLIRPPTA